MHVSRPPFTNTHTHTCTHTCTHTYTYTRVHTCTHTHTYTHMHTSTHIHRVLYSINGNALTYDVCRYICVLIVTDIMYIYIP